MKAFQGLIGEFEKHNIQVLGVNPGSIQSHMKVKEKFQLTYPLLSDPESTLAQQLGIAKPAVFSKKLKQYGRHSFIIKNGEVIKEYKNVKSPGQHPKEVLGFIQEQK